MHDAKITGKVQFLQIVRRYLLYGMIITIIFSRLNVNSLCMILFTLTWIIEGNFKDKWRLLKNDKLFIAYGLYFLVQFVGMTQSDNLYSGWLGVEDKLGFLMLPMVFCSTPFLDVAMRRKVMTLFSISITIAAIYCLVIAGIQYSGTGNNEFFFYHQLVSPISQHAVYFSVYTFIVFVFLIRENNSLLWKAKYRVFYISWIIFLLLFLVLLSSKMALLVVILFLFYLLFRSGNKKIKRWQAVGGGILTILAITAIMTTSNPVQKRFIDLKGSIELLKKEKYDAGYYFNGWQFRLLLWRVTYEILMERHAWVTGVGSPRAQAILQDKYLGLGLYGGDRNSDDHGYLKYNCHNQFLQTILQSGILGLLFFSAWCYLLFKRAVPKKEPVLIWELVMLICFFFIESVCERQYGIPLCTLIPLMYLYTVNDKASPVSA
ncbi:MAG: O-antigen ligase family protein [Ginsengibacter sp.]